MRDQAPTDRAYLPLQVLDRIDQVCDRFEAACEAGNRPRLEDFLDEIDDAHRLVLLRELLAAEIAARRRHGEQPTPEEYAALCPEGAESILDLFLTTSSSHGDRPGPPRGVESNPPDRLGDYRIERLIGRGGMGVVYRAFDERHGTSVALKTMRQADPAGFVRFKREFRALADISHPNLVTLHELREVEGTWFFTMELVEGVDFLTFVRSGAELRAPEPLDWTTSPGRCTPGSGLSATDLVDDPGEGEPSGLWYSPSDRPAPVLGSDPAVVGRLRSALGQLAAAVAFLHEAGQLHRDLKPSNVIVTGHGRVVVLDFGLAAELGPSGLHQSSATQILGTAAYMSPEQAAGQAVSPVSDWYSVGAMLYQALTGRPPFLGPPLDVLIQKQSIDPPAPRELAPGNPEDLNALCTDLLRRSPESRPTGRDVLDRLGIGAVGTDPLGPQPPHHSRPAPLVGRAVEHQCLVTAFADMLGGQTVALYIHGPSGVGKSALVRCFLEHRAVRDDALVLSGRCYEQESVPYKALDSVVDALARHLRHLPIAQAQAILPRDIRSLSRIFPVLRSVEAVTTVPRLAAEVPDPQELRRRAFQALRELLARIGDRRPLVMAIDDLQWGDSDSAAVLTELLRPPDAPRLLLLGCYRSEDAASSPLLRALLGAPEAGIESIDRRELALGALEPGDAEELAMMLLDRDDDAARAHAEAIAHESGGNPYFVAELARHVQDDSGLPERKPRTDQLALDEVLWSRVLRVPDEARRLLEVVAVSGRPVDQAVAYRAAGLGADERAAAALLRSGRLIRGTGRGASEEIETYHDRVREAVVARIPAAELVQHHRRLGEALEQLGGADPEVLAVHLHGAGQFERAATYFAEAAARAARALAFDRAAKLYRAALEQWSWPDVEARQLRVELANAFANAGRGPEAAREYVIAADGCDADRVFELRSRAALYFLTSGLIDEGIAELSAVLDMVGMAIPATPVRAVLALVLARIPLRLRGLRFRQRDASEIDPEDVKRIDVCWTAANAFGLIDVLRGAYFQARGLLLALRAGEPYRIARSLTFEMVHVSVAGGRSRRRTEAIRRACEDLAKRLDDPYTWGRFVGMQGMAAYMCGEWKRAVELSDRGAEILRTNRRGAMWEVELAGIFSLWGLLYQGEYAELGRRWPILAKDIRERGNVHLTAILDALLMTNLRLAADDPGGAESELQRAISRWTPPGFLVQHNEWFGAEVLIRLYRGDGADAWRFIASRYTPSLARSQLMRLQRIRIVFAERRARCALAAAVHAPDPRPLLRSAARDAKRLRREGMPWSRALAFPIRAGIAAARGDNERAAALFADAVTRLEEVDMNLYAAASRRRLGELLGGDEGQAHMEKADSWMRSQTIRNPARMADVFAPAAGRTTAIGR